MHPVVFEKQKIQLVQNKKVKALIVDLASTAKEHEYGMMNRTKLAPDEGMLFVFANPEVREFWMKNTLVDLDIAYIDQNKKIIDIQTMKAVTSVLQTQLATYPSKGPAQFALEVKAGWFKKNKISVGAELKILSRPKSK